MNRDAEAQPLFRPDSEDIRRVDADVADIDQIQRELCERHPDLKCPDRVAHQYQIAGSKVLLYVAMDLPAELIGLGLFIPRAEHIGIARLSTGLGTPHIETVPDFLGLRLSFLSPGGNQVDFFAFNNPTAPSDNHLDLMKVLHATADATPTHAPNPSSVAADQTPFATALIRRLGPDMARKTRAHIEKQGARSARSSTAYQTYWSGVMEANATLGKFSFVPCSQENFERALHPGERYLTMEWMRRQAVGEVAFDVYWFHYLDEQRTPLRRLTQPWFEAHRQWVGRLVFPKTDGSHASAELWSQLAVEMAVNPGNWVSASPDEVLEPSTEFGLARKLAYARSARGRDALPLDAFRSVFCQGCIDESLAQELMRRTARKRRLQHIDRAP